MSQGLQFNSSWEHCLHERFVEAVAHAGAQHLRGAKCPHCGQHSRHHRVRGRPMVVWSATDQTFLVVARSDERFWHYPHFPVFEIPEHRFGFLVGFKWRDGDPTYEEAREIIIRYFSQDAKAWQKVRRVLLQAGALQKAVEAKNEVVQV